MIQQFGRLIGHFQCPLNFKKNFDRFIQFCYIDSGSVYINFDPESREILSALIPGFWEIGYFFSVYYYVMPERILMKNWIPFLQDLYMASLYRHCNLFE
ncbi:MAG: hypothetical protein B6244_08950 [Candidatus Cloacimonetes bacterium 4572_55]|nr:MAG: hypothetical protein B6244_08950 [Candidatus Cloacimonetes bacterium 4572_55]